MYYGSGTVDKKRIERAIGQPADADAYAAVTSWPPS